MQTRFERLAILKPPAVPGDVLLSKFQVPKYIKRYLAEVQYRFNRGFDLKSIFPRLLYAGVKTGKRTEVWLRLTED